MEKCGRFIRRWTYLCRSFPIDNEIPILQSWGLSKIDVFDYAEDWCLHREPDLMTFILVHYERWNYFTEVQKGKPSINQLDPSTLPAKSEHAGGVVWLPRILPKARAKLRGELPDDVMYGCGGDRQFFQLNNIHPAEFLRVARNYDEMMTKESLIGSQPVKIFLLYLLHLFKFLNLMNFEKYHALGNDYLVFDPRKKHHAFTPEQTIRICHRNFGLGSDGILVGPLPTDRADFGLQILNPDGSEAEKSGNGLAIFARYLRDAKLVGKNPFTVNTLGGVVSCEVSNDASTISVEMGQVSFHSDIIPVSIEGDPREVLEENIVLPDTNFIYYAATIGNPHCIVPVNELSESLAKKYGPELENHSNFPNHVQMYNFSKFSTVIG